ncbi:MAG: hypothetical protein AB7S70_05325, partial [Hyphomicrobium sp.]
TALGDRCRAAYATTATVAGILQAATAHGAMHSPRLASAPSRSDRRATYPARRESAAQIESLRSPRHLPGAA